MKLRVASLGKAALVIKAREHSGSSNLLAEMFSSRRDGSAWSAHASTTPPSSSFRASDFDSLYTSWVVNLSRPGGQESESVEVTL